MEKITMTRTTYELKEGTKGAYKETKSTTKEIDRTHYNYFIDAAPFFRRLGGSEYLEKSYTSAGYLVTRVTSKSPDRQIKKITTFKFEL